MPKLAVAIVSVCLIAISLPTLAPAQTAPTFVGVRTFLSAPYEPDLDKLHADFAVLGVPFDEGTWGQPGERYGPRDLPENSQEYAHHLPDGFSYLHAPPAPLNATPSAILPVVISLSTF